MASGDRQGGAGEERIELLHLPVLEAGPFGRGDDTAWLDACWTEGAHVATIVPPGDLGSRRSDSRPR